MIPLFSTNDSGQYDLVLISSQLASVLSYHQEAPTFISCYCHSANVSDHPIESQSLRHRPAFLGACGMMSKSTILMLGRHTRYKYSKHSFQISKWGVDRWAHFRQTTININQPTDW